MICQRCGKRTRWLNKRGSRTRRLYEETGAALVAGSFGLSPAKTYALHVCDGHKPGSVVEQAARAASDPVARAAFAEIAKWSK